jgi:hypothetical protein
VRWVTDICNAIVKREGFLMIGERVGWYVYTKGKEMP